MGIPAFYRKLSADVRREFDAEIRKRAYADCHGLASWLAAKGIVVTKTPVHKYAQQLRAQDDALAIGSLPPQTILAIVECTTLALKTLSAFRHVLDTLPHAERPETTD